MNDVHGYTRNFHAFSLIPFAANKRKHPFVTEREFPFENIIKLSRETYERQVRPQPSCPYNFPIQCLVFFATFFHNITLAISLKIEILRRIDFFLFLHVLYMQIFFILKFGNIPKYYFSESFNLKFSLRY